MKVDDNRPSNCVAYLIGLPLELMVIAVLLRGEYQRYPFIFLYAVVDFLTTVIEIPSALAYVHETPEAKKQWAMMFWINERIMQVLVFLLVISLVYNATETPALPPHLTHRDHLRHRAGGGDFVLGHYYDPNARPGKFRYMTPWTRDLNFCAAILDMGLWVLLIGSRQKDRKLLLITGATWAFNSPAVRLARPCATCRRRSWLAASDFVVITNLARLYIWWQAFRRSPPNLLRQTASPNEKQPCVAAWLLLFSLEVTPINR